MKHKPISYIIVAFIFLFPLILAKYHNSSRDKLSKENLGKNLIISLRPVSPNPGNSSENQKTIKIGVILPLTGIQSPWGKEALQGVKLAFKNEFNGLLKSKPLEIIEADSCSQKEEAKKATKQLIDQGAVCILGELNSDLSLEVAEICFQHGIPLITLAATLPKLTAIGNNIFRICFDDEFQGPMLARFAFNECKVKKIGILTECNNIYSESLSSTFKQAFKELSGTVLEEHIYSANEQAFTQALKTMKQKGCQGLFVSGFFRKAELILDQARKLKFEVYKFGGDGWDFATHKQQKNKSVIGSFYSSHYNILDERPEVQSFVELWKNSYKTLPKGVAGALGYDAGLIMSQAIKRAKHPNSVPITYALNELEKIQGVTGEITFKNNQGTPHKQGIICTLTNKGPIFHQSYEYREIFP